MLCRDGCGTSDAVVGVLDGRRGGVGGGRGGRRGGAAHVLAPHAHGTPAPGLAPQEFLQLVHRGIVSSYRRQSPELHGRTAPALSLLLVEEGVLVVEPETSISTLTPVQAAHSLLCANLQRTSHTVICR